MQSANTRTGAVRTVNSAASQASAAGAMTEEQFRTFIETSPAIRTHSFKETISECQKQAAILENLNNDWNKRVKALQALRGLLKPVDEADYAAFAEQAYALLGTALELSVKDLRSQVCREACITVAFYCEKLGTSFWRVAEALLTITMNLTQNSAKIMASSGHICNNYIARNIQHSKVLSIVVHQINHKAKEVRRMAITMVAIIIHIWDNQMVERHAPELMQAVKTALSDADPEARALARQAFEHLQNQYPNKADALFQALEPSKQRMLTERSSTASSTHSINSERDNLPNPNRGLYNVQTAFLNKRSASDLNHTVRRMNLVPSRVAQTRPNAIGKPPQASVFRPNMAPLTPSARKYAPPANVIKVEKSTSSENSAKATSSQPGSRSNSPGRNRHQPPQSIVRKNYHTAAATPTKKIANGHEHKIGITPVKPQPVHKDIVRALKNVDIQSRNIRPNVIRSDDPRAYANSPNALTQHNLAQYNDSPQDFYGLSAKKEPITFNRINSAEDYSLESERRRKTSSTHNTSGKSLTGDEYENANNKWSFLSPDILSNDHNEQANFIQEICDVLTDEEADEKEVEGSLQVLARMIRENGITLWDEYFNNIFLAIKLTLSRQTKNASVKIGALKAMKELCFAQPKRLTTKTELVLMSILNAHECEEASVVRAAEDCGNALASRLNTSTCMNLLITVIDDQNSKCYQLTGAIKMLSSVISKLPQEEVDALLPDIASRMTRCYENAQSMVRRAAIMCLVSISNAIGLEHLKPHLSQSTLKLVEVYAARTTKKENSS